MKKKNALRLLKDNFNLIYSSTLDELKKKNAGSILGSFWLILYSLSLLSVYATIYIIIFDIRLPQLSQLDYVLYIFAGLVPFLAISESLSMTTQCLVGSKNLLKNTVFPIDILPVISVFRSHVGFISGMVLITLLGTYLHHLSFLYLLLPVIIVLQVMFLIGVGWFLSIINIVLKDTQNFIVFFNMILMVSSPIAYTPDMVPKKLSLIISWNPFAKYIICYQYILVYEKLPPQNILISMVIISILMFFIGYRFFHNFRNTVVNYV